MSTPANAINEATTGITGFTSTSWVATPVTAHNLLIGGSTSSTITNLAPSATSGIPVISQGTSADPTFGTAVVPGGGTGVTSATAYAVLCGGVTSTSAFQSIASVGSSGQVLVSNGPGALPTFQTVGNAGAFVLIQTKTVSAVPSITFTSIPSFNNYLFFYSGMVPSVNGVELDLRYSTNNGVSYANSGYVCAIDTNRATINTYHQEFTTSTTSAILCQALSFGTGGSASGYTFLTNCNFANSVNAGITGQIANNGNLANAGIYLPMGLLGNTAAINAWQIIPASGNISGSVSLYGIPS